MKTTVALISLVAVGIAFGETPEIRRGEYTLTYTDCPKCAMRARFAPDGKRAFLNTSKVAEKDRAAMAERIFALMEKAADTKKGGANRPLMGWSSWNTFGIAISEDIILSVAQAMATNGLKDAGYLYVNIDDGFFNGHDKETGILKWNYQRFPNGMKPVVDGIHALGLKAGTYSDAGTDTCGSLYSGDKLGFGSGLYGHDDADCKLHFLDLGFDFIKVDYCGGRHLKLDERKRYTEISQAIRRTGRKDVRFNICRWAFPGTWAADVAESWRTTGDVRANWRSVRGIIRENLYLSAYAKPGHFNDLDMLQVGRYVGQIKNAYAKSDTGLTLEEEATHFGMWCMLSSPLLIGCDVRNIPATTLELVTNPYLLAMNQNDLGLAGYVVKREGEAYVFVKDADVRFGTARFLALYNAEDNPHDFSVAFADLDLGGKVQAMDLGERADLGVFETAFAATVPAHGARFYRLDAEKRLDRTVYEAECAYLTEYQELKDGAKVGTAFPDEVKDASNGVSVRYLGNRETNDLVWKDVKVSAAGEYRLTFFFSREEGRGFDVQVDGGAKKRLTFSGGPVTLDVPLAAGVHSVRVSNATAWCPDLDRMTVEPVKPAVLTLGKAAEGHPVPKTLWGLFFEDINWAADGGLNPEMLANGGFDWQQEDHQTLGRDEKPWNCVQDGWEADFREGGMARLSFQYGAPVHPNTAKHLRIEAFGTGRAGVRNRGLDGMWIKKGEPYRLTYDWREIALDGIDYKLGEWKRETVDFTAETTGNRQLTTNNRFDIVLEPDKDRVTLSILVKGRRAVEFDNCSLLPTGPNLVRAGLRKDLVDKLAALKPAFVRFPGGCVAEGSDFQHWFDWRRTVGPKERRECIGNRWVRKDRPYWQTFGVGYYEYFRLCEEIGAEPLPICIAGITCQFCRPTPMCDIKDADYFANVIVELIEFANGDAGTTWGKVRAEMGHPKPFGLKMVGVGNENWGAEFLDRYEAIAKIVRAKHPEIRLVGSVGAAPEGKDFELAWKRATRATADLMDEHYYKSPEWFLAGAKRYDNYDRAKPHVYAGEYACHHKVGKQMLNTHWSAVCEAAMMTGFERNSDVVEMASYAPLFARAGHDQWAVDMIWFDGTESWATPNYYVQQLFALNRPDVEVPVALADADGLYACAGVRDGKEIVKVVNATDGPRSVLVNLSGAATVTTLAGEKNAVNERGRETVKPVAAAVTLAADRPLALPPRSVTVIVVK